MKNLLKVAILMVAAIGFAIVVANAQGDWPKEIPTDNGGKIVIYQPQPESFDGNQLSARAAVSIATSSDTQETFGAIFFDATLQTDKDSRTATLESLNITQAKFPGIQDQQQVANYTQIVQNEVPKWNMQFSIDQLLTSIQQTKQLNDPNLKNDAPSVIYKDKPTTLVIIDGEPKLQMDKESGMQKVVNTPSTIVLNPDDNLYYLYGGGLWYASNNVLGGWSYVQNLPPRIQQFDAQIQQKIKSTDGDNDDKPATPTEILVSTKPAELIQTEGAPTYQTVEGTSLLYVNNTMNDIFKDINTQQNYILISGRWYTSNSLNGGWTYVPSNQLPPDFAKIPEGTEKDGVLSSVAGTDAANEALIDAQIPQTAKVDRRTATINVTYDGAPIFAPIPGTRLMSAENSSVTVLKSHGRYYAVDNGIWYISYDPMGPWQVATDRPDEVNNIPPDNPCYNVKYVYVYDYTPDYVYTGYTSGYLGCYTYGPTVVWGTGWYYRPWYRHYYYPRPYTWGFGMAYNPWTGWNIGYYTGYSLGWHYYDARPYGGGWFGPVSYHPPYHPWGFNGGFYGNRGSVFINQPHLMINRPAYVSANAHYNSRDAFEGKNHSINLYNRVQGAKTIDVNRFAAKQNNQHFEKGGANNSFNNARPIGNNNGNTRNNIPSNANTGGWARPYAQPSKQVNNVATDRQGNIYKNDNDGWKQRENSTWKPAAPTQTPDLNRVQQQRDRAGLRDANFTRSNPQPQQAPRQQSRPAPQRSSGGGGGGRHR